MISSNFRPAQGLSFQGKPAQAQLRQLPVTPKAAPKFGDSFDMMDDVMDDPSSQSTAAASTSAMMIPGVNTVLALGVGLIGLISLPFLACWGSGRASKSSSEASSEG